ncbi:hypothetical protein TR74_11530 [Carbonactinospora thermoautotrophica]|uniref:UvrD-like helicase ATP-binding domain-containing protein n=1 Tax=Carbonactinospora thermoautotrophica TaxID=1469144 RepID=A0A132NGB3_9ACTN|nr:ATP-dependent helicase [Carbonactinospora thermoautotrophica]KWX09119.1 hypothetical protein TR74_11530 [Carbonactinospora thermoautotrophica]
MTFEQLTAEQRQVADATAPTMLVFGGAGVGKTTTALWAARRELTAHGTSSKPLPGRRVLFVTFSRTAVAQIRSRAGNVLTGMEDAVEILTFHGLAFRLLCAFGRYTGLPGVPVLRGEARTKLATPSPTDYTLTYSDLLPRALTLLETPGPIASLIRSRWSLVICDEFQDTDEEEWRLLQALGRNARLLLLADPNQMIYQFKDGVSEARLDAARARPGCVEVTLQQGSYRDPTQVLPNAAADIRWRRFTTPAVRAAVDAGRLLVYRDVPDTDAERAAVIDAEIRRLQADGHTTIGVYAKTNSDAAGLSAALTDRGVDHVPVGFSEAYGETLAALLTMVRYSAGVADWSEVLTGLATVLTANHRGSKPPDLAWALHAGLHLPNALVDRLTKIKLGLDEAAEPLEEAVVTATQAWNVLGFTSGRRTWNRASRAFTALAARARLHVVDPLGQLERAVAAARDASFVELDGGDTGHIQLMNFSQTKGREADATILSYTSNDWYGRGACEPYDEASRILYVSMTRARNIVVILLPPQPHPLVAPFTRYSKPFPIDII